MSTTQVEGERSDPPPLASAAQNESWIIGDSPTGEWTGETPGRIAIAAFTRARWLVVAPSRGDEVYDKAGGGKREFDGTSWSGVRVRGSRCANIPNPTLAAPQEIAEKVNQVLVILRAAGIVGP